MKKIAILPTFNEEKRVPAILAKFSPGIVDEIVVVNDGSTDRTGEIAASLGATVITHAAKLGVGEGIKDGIRYAIQKNYDIIVIMAGNGKDDPREIPSLVRPIVDGKADYVQGSRFLTGGQHENNPLVRVIAIRLFSIVWSVVTGTKITDITNGFRAYRPQIFENPKVNIWQEWLGTYELEYYLHYQVLKQGYRVCEVPVSKNYPSKVNYTKIKPFLDWWKIIKPLIYLTLGVRK